jgi:imidazolonepropionase-like amidohydrolase
MHSYVLREARVLDESGGFTEPLDVRVEDGRVAAVGRTLPADTASYDFSGLWVMPGMFDCHLHVGSTTLELAQWMRRPASEWALETAATCRTTLAGGVTFVRDCSGADAGIRDGIGKGYVIGPELQVSIVLICMTGGHDDGFLPGPGTETSVMPNYPGRPPYRADGVDQMRLVVRSALRSGADFVKLATTGGLLSDHDHPLEPQFTFEEIEAAVVEARRKGRGVASHAFGGEGLRNAVRAGVRSIEHGFFMTEEDAALMAEHGTWLVPTLSILRDDVRWAEEGLLPPNQCQKILDLEIDFGAAVALAKEHGVRIAAGTDYITADQHGHNLEELALMHRAGLTVEEALLAGTAGGAELCDVAGSHGRIAPGYVFDAIVLDEDPGDLSRFGEPDLVRGVFKSGAPVVPHERLA